MARHPNSFGLPPMLPFCNDESSVEKTSGLSRTDAVRDGVAEIATEFSVEIHVLACFWSCSLRCMRAAIESSCNFCGVGNVLGDHASAVYLNLSTAMHPHGCF